MIALLQLIPALLFLLLAVCWLFDRVMMVWFWFRAITLAQALIIIAAGGSDFVVALNAFFLTPIAVGHVIDCHRLARVRRRVVALVSECPQVGILTRIVFLDRDVRLRAFIGVASSGSQP